MARVPTWTELRCDAIKLANLQKECYRRVDELIDSALPKLDKKILSLQMHKLEHLQPLPMPLSEYLKKNRPALVARADRRVMYLKKISEKRKLFSSMRLINSLEQVRLSSNNYNGHSNDYHYTHQHYQQHPHPKDYQIAPDYLVKYKLSEREMKRLTAKNYRRLPEVKRRRKEEVTNQMKVQNYKNRMEYGKKLLENRRQGIINYPLRATQYDELGSITSSQSEYSICGGDGFRRSADLFRTDPYY